jgi:hypothetical protein
MCKVNPKKTWNRYYRLDGTKEFITELEGALGQIWPNKLIDKRQNNVGNKDRGTWVQYNMLKGTKEFIRELESALRIRRAQLIVSIEGNSKAGAGTWVHIKIAIALRGRPTSSPQVDVQGES